MSQTNTQPVGRQKKAFPFELKAKGDDGTFEGYASVFGNVDLGGDVIVEGAFKQIKKNKLGLTKLALFHDLERLAGTVKVAEDSKGLHVEGKLSLGVSYVRDAYELMKDGVLDEMSIGYDINKGGIEHKEVDGEHVWYLTDLTLWECSLVPFGMNPEAQLTEVKSLRDVEAIIRKDYGLSRKGTKAVVSLVKESLQQDAGSDSQLSDSEVSAMLDHVKKFKF